MESLSLNECRRPRTNILLVDTNVTTLLDMKERMMGRYADQVMIETDAERAMLFLTNCRHEINLVIWDYHMPGIDGIQALKTIGSKLDLPVVIISDDNERDSVMEATFHGACDFVTKPVSEQVLAVIWQHIVRKRIKSKQVLVPVKQSNLAQSSGFNQVKDVLKFVNQELLTERNQEKSAGKRPVWTGEFQPDLVQTNDKIEENATKKPRTEETQLVQTEGSNSVGSDNYILIDEDKSEESMEDKKGKKPRKQRVIWTGDLHQSFLAAVKRIGGVEKANPTLLLKCLEDMKIEGLSRYNVASHLQKYRISLQEAGIANQKTQDLGWFSSQPGSNNVQTDSSSSILTGQTMNPIQPNQYQNGYQFIPNPLPQFPNVDRPDEHQQQQQYQSSNQQLQYQSSNQQQQYQPSPEQQQYQPSTQQEQYQAFAQQQQYQPSPEQQQYQPSTQHEQYQAFAQQQQYQPSPEQQQYQPSTQHEQYQPFAQQQQYQPSTQEQQYQSSSSQPQQHQFSNEQAPDMSATDVELIYPGLPYDPKEFFLNGYNSNQ